MLGFDDGLPEEGHGCLSGFDGVLVTSNLDVLGLDFLLDSGLDQTFPILVDFESLSSHLLTNDSFAFFGPTQLTHNLTDSCRLKFIAWVTQQTFRIKTDSLSTKQFQIF